MLKTIGIQIKSNEAIIVVLQDNNGKIEITNESCKLNIQDVNNADEIKQFRDQINATFNAIKPTRIGILARNAKAKGTHAPSPISFKLEGIIQLFDGGNIELVWPQTISAYFKKHKRSVSAKNNYQEEALNVAYYLIS